MGCSNARLLVQTPLPEQGATGVITTNPANTTANLPSVTATSGETTGGAAAADSSTRMHLTGVDLVVERNGSYTLLLTPKTHKQLMPYVLRKKRFRILVDKARSTPATTSGLETTIPLPIAVPTSTVYEQSSLDNRNNLTMESGKELKLSAKKLKKLSKQQQQQASTVESVEEIASNELDKAKARIIGGRSIDRGDPEDDDEYVQSDDEGMVEEIVTTVEEDKDLECKVKKKIETKKTVAEDPETHNKVTKVVKTEVTEITRTITINDQHDLERAKRELGIDDVNKLLPSSQVIYNLPSSYRSTTSWIDHPRLTEVKERHYDPSNEIVTSGDFGLVVDSPTKSTLTSTSHVEDRTTTVTPKTPQDSSLASATSVGRGIAAENTPPLTTTVAAPGSDDEKKVSIKKEKKSKKTTGGLCSCASRPPRDLSDEQRKQQAATIVEQKSKQKKKASVSATNAALSATAAVSPIKSSPPPPPPEVAQYTSVIDSQIQGEQLISDDIKQLIVNKKSLLIDYIHKHIFTPAQLITNHEHDVKCRKISSRILDLLRYNRCSSWIQMSEQLTSEYGDQLPGNLFIRPMVQSYQTLLTDRQTSILQTFKSIEKEKDLKKLPNNSNDILLVQTYLAERDRTPNIGLVAKPFVENFEQTLECLTQYIEPTTTDKESRQQEGDEQQHRPLIRTKEYEMSNEQSPALYDEEQLSKMLRDISQHKPITLAEAIAYEYLDLDDPKLGLASETALRIKKIFRPASGLDDDSTSNTIRVKRAGQPIAELDLNDPNALDKLHLPEHFVYRLQQSFQPMIDLEEKQFRLLTEAVHTTDNEQQDIEFDIGRTSLPGTMKEPSSHDFSASDSGYSMTTATQESLASKAGGGNFKIEFEPINEPIQVVPNVETPTTERIDLDKATPDELAQHELNPDLIHIIKSDYNGTDKTIGQAILARDLRLDSTDPVDIARVRAAGIDADQARIFFAFFFPTHTRTIAYSPEPGRFVEAQTTYNAEEAPYPSHNIDTTVIQIQEKQLSSDHHAMQRDAVDEEINIHPIYRPTPLPVVPKRTAVEQEPAPLVTTQEIPSPTVQEQPPVVVKKRKSSGGGLLACFGCKKPKAGTEQRGQPTATALTSTTPSGVLSTQTTVLSPPPPPIQGKPMIDYAMTADGKRIYIDVFRERPGLDMSYTPTDFDTRFIVPVTKPASEYERAVTPDIEEQHQLPSSVEESIETTTSRVHLEPRSPIIEPVQIEPEHKKPVVHLEPRPATIEPVEKIDTNEPPLITSLLTTETPSKTTTLHGAAVDLPEIQLVTPGPLPTLPIGKHSKKPKTKVKKEKIEASTSPKKVSGGLCASCFGKKAAEKKKKQETISSLETKAPIEQKKIIEEEKKQDSSPAPPVVLTTTTTTEEPPLPPPTTTTETHSSVLPKIDIDTFKPRDFGKGAENLPKPDDYLGATLEPLVHIEEPHYQLPSGEPVPPIPIPIENEYSMPESDRNTYDIPRSIEIDQIHVDNETMLTRTSDMQRSGGDFVLTPTPVLVDEKSIGLDDASKLPTVTIESSSPIASRIDTTMPRVDIDESANKGSYTLPAVKTKKSKIKEPKPKKEKKEKKVKEPKSEKKSHSSSGLFGGLFRGSNRKSATIQVPALDLPPVERDLSPENNEPHRRTSDSFHIPAVDLPKPNIPLPTYDRPEVDMMTGTSRHSSEFAVPSVNLPVLVDVQLPVDDQQNKAALLSSKDLMHIPHVELPEVQFTSEIPIQPVQHEQKTEIVKVIDYQGKPVESGPTLESGLILSSPVSDMLNIQTDHTTFPIETDYAAPALVKDLPATEETTIISPPPPPLPTFPSVDETPITQPELLSTEQKYTITDTHFVQPPELTPPLTETKPSDIESPPKLPDFSFELPSLEPVSASPKRTAPPPPSFDDDVPSSSPKLVPAVEPLTAITPQIDVESKPQPGEKQRIDATIGKIKLPTTGGLCSCFGEKSKKAPAPTTPTETVPKEKKVKKAKKEKKTSTKPIAAPTTDLPEVKIPVPSSNISSTLTTKGSLRAPAADLPPVDLKAPESEPIRLSLATKSHEKKRKAPKVPPATESKVASTPESQQVPPPTSSETVPIDVPDFALKGPSITIPSLDLEPKAKPPTPPPSPVVEPQPVTAEEIETKDKKTSAFEIKAPAVTIPDLDLSGPGATDAYMSSTSKPQPIVAQSRSDSGLEAIISSHMHSSSTFGTKSTIDESTAVLPDTSVSSGLGSEILDGVATKGYTLTDLKQQQQQPPISDETQQQSLKRDSSLLRHDFARKITMNDEIRAKLIYRQSELKKLLETEIAQSIDDFDTKKDGKALSKILGHGIDLVKDKKVTTYPDLKQKLIIDHKHEAFIVDPVVRSLYVTIEQQGLDNLDKPEFPLAVRDMVRLPAKQTFETIAHLNKDSTPGGSLTNEGTQMTTTTKEISVADVGTTNQSAPISQNQQTPPTDVARSCLTCGRSKSKTKKPSAPTTPAGTNNSVSTHPVGLLDERRRLQLASHRTELGNILRDHLLSTQPSIRRFPDHPKEVDKIIRKSLVLVAQPKILSYEQLRNDLKTEYKHTFYLIDPTIDVIRDTFDHCDITQMHEKINIDILDANIAQTAALYNQTELQTNLLTNEEFELMKTKQQQPWLRDYLREREVKEKKLHRKQNKELGKILDRTLEILPLNQVQTWDELAAQLRREYPKAHDLCDRSVELIKQGQKDGLLTQRQAPGTTTQQQDVTSINILNGGQRRPSSLITERARQNLKTNRSGIISSFGRLLVEYNKPLYQQNQIEIFINETLNYLEQQQQPNGLFRDYNDVKERLKKDHKQNHDKLIGQIVDVIEQAHAVNQFDDLEKSEVQTLMRDRLNGKPLILKEMYVSLPPRVGAYGSTRHGDDPSSSSGLFSTSGSHLINGDPSLNNSSASHRVGRGLSWREANERARILFYRGKHPAIHYDEQSDGFDVRMLLETNSGGTQEIPVTDSDVHELLNSCGVQWDGVNLISLVDHSEVLVRAAEEAALKVIREKGVVDLRPPPTPSATDEDELEVPPPPSSSTPTASSS